MSSCLILNITQHSRVAMRCRVMSVKECSEPLLAQITADRGSTTKAFCFKTEPWPWSASVALDLDIHSGPMLASFSVHVLLDLLMNFVPINPIRRQWILRN